MFLSVSVRRLCGGYSQCGTSAGPPDFVLQNYRKLFNRPNYTYYYIRHFLFFLVSWGLWNTFCLFLISFSHRYTFHSACRHDISFPRHLSVPALIPLSPRAHVRQRRQHHLSLPALIHSSPRLHGRQRRQHHLSVPALIPLSPRAHVRQWRQHHLSVPALIPSSPFWPMKPVLSKSVTLRFRTAFQAIAVSSIATSAAPGLSIVTHPKGLPDSNNSRTWIQNLLDEYKSTNAPDSFIWLSIMRYP